MFLFWNLPDEEKMFHKAFRDSALEREYQADLAPEKVRLTRVAVVLITLLNAAFVTLDFWAIPSALVEVWTIRLVMNLVVAVCFAFTWYRRFPEIYTSVNVLLFLSLGLGINTMIYIAEPTDFAINTYYGGLLLITFGIYALSYIGLGTSMLLSLALIGGYTGISIFVHDFLEPGKMVVLIANLFFFLATTVLGIVAKSIRDRFSKENYLLRHSLERDIELREEEKQRASYLAEHDALTGLPNRRSFERKAGAILATAAAHERSQATLLFVDLNDFKPINDRHGHTIGDRVLKVIAARLKNALRRSDAIARFGGDEFLICLPDTSEVAPIIKKLLDVIAQPIELRNDVINLSASIGYANYPDHGNTLEELIRAADDEMYRRKQSVSHLVVAS